MARKKTGIVNQYPITQDSAGKCFGTQLRNSRESAKRSQKWLADHIHKSRVMIANYEAGKASPEPNVAVKLARILSEDPAEYLLLSNLQRVYSLQHTEDKYLLQTINQLLSKNRKSGFSPLISASLETYLSLLDFPKAFTPMTVIVGDKREEEPQNPGDLFVFSASTVDDRWLLSLGLPPNTEKISDKVIMTAEQDSDWLEKHLGNKHLLCIGSPASNLFARMFNNNFLFRFAISRETQRKWEETHKDIGELRTQASLLKFHEDHRSYLKQRMRLFKSPGFVDFNYEYLRVGMDLSQGKDFAVVSLGHNPYAKPDAPYYAILAAGVHHPGTAHAVKFLSEPANFVDHPFGGILEVDVPSKNVDPRDIYWHSKIENSEAHWHTVGNNSLQYNPESFSQELKKWITKLPVPSDIVLEKQELEGHLRLIEKLAVIKENSDLLDEKDHCVD